MPATITHQLSATTPDDPTYEIRPSHWNSAHAITISISNTLGISNLGNTAGTSGVISGEQLRLLLAGGPNITLSQSVAGNSATITVSGGSPVVSNAIQSVASATNSGTNTSRFAADDHVHAGVFSVGVSNDAGNTIGDTRVDVGRFVLRGGNNVTLSQITAAGALNTIVISGANVGGAQTGISGVGVSDTTYSSGTVIWSAQANVTLGSSVNGASQYVRVSVGSQSNQSGAVYALGNTTGQSSSSTYDARTLSIEGAGFVSVGWSNGSFRISGTQTNPVVSNAIQSVASATNSGTNTSRFAADDHVHAGVFSVGVSNDAGNTAGDTRVDVGRFVLRGGNNVNLSQITAANALNTIVISGANAGGAQTGISGVGVSDTTYSSGTVIWSAQANVTLGSSVNGASQYVRVSVGSQSNQSGAIYALGNTTGQSSSSTYDARTLSIEGAGFISVGWSNGSFRVSGTQTNPVVSNAIQAVGSATGSGTNTSRFAADDHVHVGVYSAGVSTGGNTAGNTAARPGQWIFAGSNAITLSQETAANSLQTIHIQGPVSATTISAVASANTIGTRGSRFALEDHQHAGVFSMGVSNDAGNTSGDTRVDVGRFVLRGGNNITLSQITAAGALNTVVVSAGAGGGDTRMTAYATGNTTQSSTGTIPFSSFIFRGDGVASVGVSNGSVVISVPAGGGGGFTGGMSTFGNTAGTTGLVSNQAVFAGTGPISLSQSVNGQSLSLSIGGPATSSIVGTSGITVSTAGSTMSVQPVTLSGWDPYGLGGEFVIEVRGNGSIYLNPVNLPYVAQFDRVQFGIHNNNSSNSSGSHTLSFWVGIYTKNISTLSLFESTSSSIALTHSGTVGSYSWYSLPRMFTIPWTKTLSANNYWLALVSSTATAGANGSYWGIHISQWNTNFQGIFGASHATTIQQVLGRGYYTATSAGVPSSIAFSHIRGSDSLNWRPPWIAFGSGTA